VPRVTIVIARTARADVAAPVRSQAVIFDSAIRMLDGISKAEGSNLAESIRANPTQLHARDRSPTLSPSSFQLAHHFRRMAPRLSNIPPSGIFHFLGNVLVAFAGTPLHPTHPSITPSALHVPPSPWNNRDRFPHAVLHHLRRRLSASTRRIEDDTSIYRYVPTPVLTGRRCSLILFPRLPPRASPTHPGEFEWNYKRSSRFPRRVRAVSRDSIMELVGFSAEKFRYPPWGKGRALSAPMRDDTLRVIERNACR